MESKGTPISARGQRAFTLVEILVASSIGLVLGAGLLMFSMFTDRSFAAMTNYTDMALLSELALDNMSKDIRQARQLTSFATNSLTFTDVNGNSLQYTFDPSARTLTRVSGTQTTTYLTQCDGLRFWIYQHTPISNTFGCYDPAYVTNARVIQMTWRCSRLILGAKATTESVESATIAMRNH
jgi:prepilin-type N-terminal cleavage/methylation domain-containing protein